jgi:hypothetical protein
VVILHEMHGLTFREIAQIEGISPTRTHARYDEGMDMLRAAMERWKQEQRRKGLAPISPALTALFAADPPHAPPPDAVARAWQRVSRELGLDDGSDASPPDSARVPGKRLAKLYYLFGPIGGLLFAGGMIAATSMSRCNEPRVREERAPVIAPLPTSIEPPPIASVTAAAAAPPSIVVPAPTVAPSAIATPARTSAPTPRSREEIDNELLLREQALMDRGRTALEEKHFEAALAAVEEHASLFPRGRHAAAREQLRAEACAQIPADPRCHPRR